MACSSMWTRYWEGRRCKLWRVSGTGESSTFGVSQISGGIAEIACRFINVDEAANSHPEGSMIMCRFFVRDWRELSVLSGYKLLIYSMKQGVYSNLSIVTSVWWGGLPSRTIRKSPQIGNWDLGNRSALHCSWMGLLAWCWFAPVVCNGFSQRRKKWGNKLSWEWAP